MIIFPLDLILTLFLLMLVGGASYRAASRLWDGDTLEVLAGTLLFCISILVATFLSLSTLGILYRETLIGLTVVVAVGFSLVCSKLPVVAIERTKQPNVASPMISRIYILTLVVTFIVGAYAMRAALDERQAYTNLDVVNFEFPNVLTFAQEHTIWQYDGAYAYYFYNYQMLFGWGMVLSHSYALNTLFHATVYVLGLIYAMLLLRQLCPKVVPHILQIASAALVVALFLSRIINNEILRATGKNDLLIGVCTLACIHYVLCYWNAPEQRSSLTYIVLLGIAAGLMLGSKITSAYILLILLLGHFCTLIRRYLDQKRVMACTVSLHLFFLIVGVGLFAGVWVHRFLHYPFTSEELAFIASGLQTTVIKRFMEPSVLADTRAGALPLVIVALGVLVTFFPRVRSRNKDNPSAHSASHLRTTMGILLMVGSTMSGLFFERFNLQSSLAPLLMGLSLAGACVVGKLTRRDLIDTRVFFIAILALSSFVAFLFTPYAIWLDSAMVGYRYAYSGFVLIILLLTVLVIRHVETFKMSTNNLDLQIPKLTNVMASHSPVVSLIILVLFIGIAAIKLFTYVPPIDMSVPDKTGATAAPTFVAWVNQHISQSSLFVVEMRPFYFYGTHLDNAVQYQPDANRLIQETSIYPINWTTTQLKDYLQLHQIQYLLFPLHFRINLLERTQLDLDDLRKDYQVAYENKFAIVFRTYPAA